MESDWAHAYDALGDPLTYTDRNGTTHAYSYDALGRETADTIMNLASGVDGSVMKLGFAYDDVGRLFTSTSYDGNDDIVNQVEDLYDGLGNIATEYQSHDGAVDTATTPSVGYTYDVANGDQLTSEIYPGGRTIAYNYDSGLDSTASRISSISDSSGTLQSYSYLGLSTPVTFSDGNGIELTYLSTSMGDAGDNVTGLDRFGRVDDQNWVNSSGTSIDEFQYGYDADSNVLYRDNTVLTDHSELYSYDGLNRLASFERGMLNGTNDGISGTPGESESWELDALGNWNSDTVNGTTTTRTNNAQNQVTQLGSATLGYDTNGNTTTDENGNMLIYDAWNHLISVKSGSTTTAGYTYDAKGQRITETHGSTTTDLYLSTSGQVLEERQDGAATAQYTWSPFYVNGLIERDDAPSGGALTRRLYVEQDANWNVTSLTDASGSVVERFEYTAYGNATVLTTGGTVTTDAYDMVYRFQGGRTDLVTGLVHFGHREFSAGLGRWMQQDPLGYVDEMSLYVAMRCNPSIFQDPWGEKVELQAHRVKHAGVNFHLSLRIIPDDQKNADKYAKPGPNGLLMLTVGAGPKGFWSQKLISDINRPTDWQTAMDDNIKRITIPRPPMYKSDQQFIDAIRNLDFYYKDKLTYNLFPQEGGDESDGYNSNSYIRGLLEAVGAHFPNPQDVFQGINGNQQVEFPGWRKPVPEKEFKCGDANAH